MKTKGQSLVKQAYQEMQKKKPSLEKAFNLLSKASNLNNSEALYAIGTWYLHGKFVKRNRNLAVEYFLRSIEGNYPNAYFDLAICYEKGVGIKKNLKKAFECYLNAALLGNKQSCNEVGRCYYYGIGISKNKSVADIWFNHSEQ